MRAGLTSINLAGLVVGMACCLLIGLYLYDELRYDKHHENGDRIQRVVIDYTTNGVTSEQGYTQGLLAPMLEAEIPEVEAATRLLGSSGLMVHGDKRFNESSLIYADPAVFSIFSFKWIRGNQVLALNEPRSIVLTEELAKKYFGDVDPIGQVLTYNNDLELTVTGIMQSPPAQSHFTFDGIISLETMDNETAPTWMFNEWLSTFVQTYVLLRADADPVQVEQKIAALVEREAGDMMRASNRWVDLLLEPLSTIYLTSQRDGLGTRGSLTNLYLFGSIAAFILLIACINYLNLATARAMTRAREVGVRKSLGAARNQLALQFLGESFLMALLAVPAALVLAKLFLPAFNELAGKSIEMGALLTPAALSALAVLILLVGLLSGLYPAMLLSGFHPVSILKGKGKHGISGERMRKSLVVFQFGLSVGLIVATAVVYNQLQFMKSQQLGFNKEQVILIDFRGDQEVRRQIEPIKDAILRVPGVLEVSASQTAPGRSIPQSGGSVQLADGTNQDISVGLYMVDFDFVDLYNLDLVAGRSMDEALASDSTEAIILNETAIARLGLPSPEEAIGLTAQFWGRPAQIIGVARDIHHFALQTRVSPMGLRYDRDNASLFSVRISPEDMPATIAGLQAMWGEWVPQRPFEYHFLDEVFDTQYRSEERFGSVFFIFTMLAIFIACLGLFGLAAFMVQQRTKEIGIRKVLGASTRSVLMLLSREFTILVCISVLLAVPIVYWAMDQWLAGFPYRIQISVWIGLGAGICALLIAWGTVSVQSLRAAFANPVDSLRYE